MAPAFVPGRRGVVVGAALLVWCSSASAAAPTWSETVSAGMVSATLTTTYADAADVILRADDLELVVTHQGGGSPTRWRGAAFRPWGPDQAIVSRDGAVQLVDITGDGEAEVLVDIYTGGAHCCSVSYVAWRSDNSARYRMRGIRWGNSAASLSDLNGDGALEFVGVDDRFATAFGPYAVAEFPARVWSLAADGPTVTTRHYRPYAMAAMRSSWAMFLEHRRRGDPTTGALAAYLANASNVGGVAVSGGWGRARRVMGTSGARTVRAIERRLRGWGYRTR